ncbi:hybrid sensor histidine kinase/response regulator [Halorhodospira halophila]|uniref:hybrid sensor histidine kinase/response regulator n=1 Tax=Halorhodospira halophila TaxID=1053 RepID=UPI001F5DDC0A|nr:PAS domain S-box protein [Halorhodospira halophila]MBK5944760.1 hypothetical protein [Halorhodospira halophila]
MPSGSSHSDTQSAELSSSIGALDLARASLDALNSHIAVIDTKGQIAFVNAAWRDFARENAGAGPSLEVGGDYLGVLKGAMEAREPNAAQAYDGIMQLLAGKTSSFEHEYPCHAPDRERWFLMQGTPLIEQGRIRGAVLNHLDITDRYLAERSRERSEQALGATNERLEQAERIARMGSWLAYPESGELIWSPMIYELGGFSREEEPSLAELLKRVPQEDRHQMAEFQLLDDPGRTACEGSYRFRHPDGRLLWVREVAKQWWDGQGRRVIQGTVQDVTDYQKTLQALRQHQRQLEAIFHRSSSIALIQTDAAGVIEEASRGAEELHGYTRDELIGESVRLFYPPEERHVPGRLLERLRHERREITEEVQRVHRSGSVFPVLLSLVPILDDTGELTGVISAAMDLSEQTAERERYRLAQEAAGFGVWDWDLQNDTIHWDAACWRMLGHDPADGCPLNFGDLRSSVHPEDRAQLEPTLWRLIEQGEPISLEFRLRCADGGWLWVQGRGQTVQCASDGRPQRLMGTYVDIQQLKATEQALRRREQELAEAKRIAGLGHWVYDIPSGSVDWSDEIYNFFGLEKADTPLDMDTFWACIPAEEHPALQEAIERALSTGEPYDIEHRIVRADGGERILQELGYAEFDADGNPRILRGTTQDVTEQRRIRRELAEREAHYRDLVENQPLMIERYLPDSTITYANRAKADYLGAEPEALIGRRWLDFLPAEERERAETHLASYIPQEPVGRFETCLPNDDGGVCWELWTIRAFFDQRGAQSHFQAVGVDITERRRAEQAEQQLREQLQARQRELEAIFEAARSVSIVKTDLESVILEASTGAEELFGYAREELIGRHASQLVTDPEVDHAHVTRLVREREPLRRETELIRRDGNTFPALLTIHPVTDYRGEVVAAVGVSLDVSDQKRAERELAEAVEAKTTFLNAVSHDLRTPLNALMGFLELLEEPGLPESQRAEYMRHCRQGAQRLLALIDSLLDLSRLQAGRLTLSPAPFDLHAVIEGQCAEHRHLAEERGFALACRIDPQLPQWVEGDATRLAQLLSNLLSNAVKYTDEGRVDLEAVPQEDGWITFRVRDTGTGISPADQEQIFSAFDRGGYAGAQRGHGLGLAIVRELLKLLGGELNLDSEPGVGTTFSVTVPLPQLAAPDKSAEANAGGDPDALEASQAVDAPERSLRVLVADDEPANVMLARIMLEQLGCSVTTAENAIDALAAWGEEAFDLLVLDRALPDLYGEQVAERIRAQEQTKGSPGVPIALYTAYGRTEVSDLLDGALFDAYLGKPLDRSELKRLVVYVAHHTRLSRL